MLRINHGLWICVSIALLSLFFSSALAYKVEPGSSANTITLRVTNRGSAGKLEDVRIFLADSPSWITDFSADPYVLGTIQTGGVKTVTFSFSVKPGIETPKAGLLRLRVAARGEEVEFKEIPLQVSEDVPAIQTSWFASCCSEPAVIDLSTFSARAYETYIELAWTTESEIDNTGFNLYRGTSKDATPAPIKAGPIPSRADELSGATYFFRDLEVLKGVTYYYWLEDIDLHGKATMHGPVSARLRSIPDMPSAFTLAQNHPNPFRDMTEIGYGLPVDAHVNLSIFNVMGQRIGTLVDGYQEAGHKTVSWKGLGEDGAEVSEGIYFYRLETGSYSEIRKMALSR